MRIVPTQEELNHRKDVWKAIVWRMNVHRITPKELASKTLYSQALIERGIGGEPVPITFPFLGACVKAFGLIGGVSGRTEYYTEYYEETVENLPESELEARLKPQPAMPTAQGNFWDNDRQND